MVKFSVPIAVPRVRFPARACGIELFFASSKLLQLNKDYLEEKEKLDKVFFKLFPQPMMLD